MAGKPQAPKPVDPAQVFPGASTHPSFQHTEQANPLGNPVFNTEKIEDRIAELKAAQILPTTPHIPSAFDDTKPIDNTIASISLDTDEDQPDVWTPSQHRTQSMSIPDAKAAPVPQPPKPKGRVAQIKASPSQFIFRLLNRSNVKVNVNGIMMDERQRTGQTSRLFLRTEDTILWPFISIAGKQTPLPLDEDLTELGTPGIQWLPRRIRYAYGLNTPFADEQEGPGIDSLKRENGRNPILDNPTNRDSLQFVNIEMRIPGNDIVRYHYLRLSNQCQNQHPKARRYGSVLPEYFMLDFAAEDRVRVEKGRLRQRMYELACTARIDEMLPHAKFLAIPLIVALTGEDRETTAIREDYKDAALANPELFDRTFSDPKVKVTFWIQELIDQGDISVGNMVTGQAHWRRTGVFICILPPDKNPIEFLAEFALTAQGEEFANQIRAIRATR